MSVVDRRQFLHLAGLAGAVAMSGLGLAKAAELAEGSNEDFYFVQMTDTHWGFEGAPNPDAHGTLPKAVAAVNALAAPPDFIIFTGDLTHTTDDPAERRKRMAEFKAIADGLKVRNVRFIPGEHDAALDDGKAFKEFFGPTHYTFDHKGVHFIVLDNVSDPGAQLGSAQLEWLAADLATQTKDGPIVVFAHRPLFDLYPQWDWATRDGAKAVALLEPFSSVAVFYGHIHQEHHHMTGHIAHHAAQSLIFPQPAPGSQPKRTPVAWNAARPYQGLGFREVGFERTVATSTAIELTEVPLVPPDAAPRVIGVVAKKFDFVPDRIEVARGEPVILEFTAPDVPMGVNMPGLNLRADIVPGRPVRLALTPQTRGTFEFTCDVFCGSGHEEMSGMLVVS